MVHLALMSKNIQVARQMTLTRERRDLPALVKVPPPASGEGQEVSLWSISKLRGEHGEKQLRREESTDALQGQILNDLDHWVQRAYLP
jgi:hypothetical protein